MTTDLKTLRSLCEAATPGPWERRVSDTDVIRLEPASERGKKVIGYVTPRTLKQIVGGEVVAGATKIAWDNAAFIAAARTALPALLDRVEALEGALAKAARKFREYEILHTAKATVEGNEKAEVNAAFAAELEAALKDTPNDR